MIRLFGSSALYYELRKTLAYVFRACCRDFKSLDTTSSHILDDLCALAPHAYLVILGLREKRYSVLQDCLQILLDFDPSDPLCVRNKRDMFLDKLEEVAYHIDYFVYVTHREPADCSIERRVKRRRRRK